MPKPRGGGVSSRGGAGPGSGRSKPRSQAAVLEQLKATAASMGVMDNTNNNSNKQRQPKSSPPPPAIPPPHAVAGSSHPQQPPSASASASAQDHSHQQQQHSHARGGTHNHAHQHTHNHAHSHPHTTFARDGGLDSENEDNDDLSDVSGSEFSISDGGEEGDDDLDDQEEDDDDIIDDDNVLDEHLHHNQLPVAGQPCASATCSHAHQPHTHTTPHSTTFMHTYTQSPSPLSLPSGIPELDKQIRLFLDCSSRGLVEAASSLFPHLPMQALDDAFLLAAEHGQIQMIQLLASRISSIHTLNARGETGLMLAARFGHRHVCESLLKEYGSSLEQRSHDGVTALYAAVEFNQLHVTEYLLNDWHANVHTADNQHNSLLHVAAHNGYTPMILLLFQHGISSNVLNDRDETPLEVGKNSDTCRVILEYHTQQSQHQQAPAATNSLTASKLPPLPALDPLPTANGKLPCAIPFRELPSGAASYLFWTAMGVGKDSYMFQNFGVYPFDRLNDTERIVILTEVAEAMSGYRKDLQPTLLNESALYAVFALMKARLKRELEDCEQTLSTAEDDESAELTDSSFIWRKRVLEAYEQVYQTQSSIAGLSVECWKKCVWNTVVNLLARSLFGSSFWDKKRMFLSPNGLERMDVLTSSPYIVAAEYWNCKLPSTLSMEIQLTFKKLITMSKTFLAADDEAANGATANNPNSMRPSGCFCQDCISELEVPLTFKLQFLEEAAEEKRRLKRHTKRAKDKARVAAEKERQEDEANRAKLDELILHHRLDLSNFWSTLSIEDKWALTEMSTGELADTITSSDQWETLRAALESYAKYAWQTDVLEISEDCVTLADDMSEERGMVDMLEAMLDAVELVQADKMSTRPPPTQQVVPATNGNNAYAMDDEEWDRRGRQMLENSVLAEFARKIAASYLLRKQESRAQQVALELEQELLQEEVRKQKKKQQPAKGKKSLKASREEAEPAASVEKPDDAPSATPPTAAAVTASNHTSSPLAAMAKEAAEIIAADEHDSEATVVQRKSRGRNKQPPPGSQPQPSKATEPTAKPNDAVAATVTTTAPLATTLPTVTKQPTPSPSPASTATADDTEVYEFVLDERPGAAFAAQMLAKAQAELPKKVEPTTNNKRSSAVATASSAAAKPAASRRTSQPVLSVNTATPTPAILPPTATWASATPTALPATLATNSTSAAPSPIPNVSHFTDGLIIVCTHEVTREGEHLKLIGLQRQHTKHTKSLKHHTSALFVFNVTDRLLYGVYEAVAISSEALATPTIQINGSGRRGRNSRTPTAAAAGNNTAAAVVKLAADDSEATEFEFHLRHEFEPLAESQFETLFDDQARIRKLDSAQVQQLLAMFKSAGEPKPTTPYIPRVVTVPIAPISSIVPIYARPSAAPPAVQTPVQPVRSPSRRQQQQQQAQQEKLAASTSADSTATGGPPAVKRASVTTLTPIMAASPSASARYVQTNKGRAALPSAPAAASEVAAVTPAPTVPTAPIASAATEAAVTNDQSKPVQNVWKLRAEQAQAKQLPEASEPLLPAPKASSTPAPPANSFPPAVQPSTSVTVPPTGMLAQAPRRSVIGTPQPASVPTPVAPPPAHPLTSSAARNVADATGSNPLFSSGVDSNSSVMSSHSSVGVASPQPSVSSLDSTSAEIHSVNRSSAATAHVPPPMAAAQSRHAAAAFSSPSQMANMQSQQQRSHTPGEMVSPTGRPHQGYGNQHFAGLHPPAGYQQQHSSYSASPQPAPAANSRGYNELNGSQYHTAHPSQYRQHSDPAADSYHEGSKGYQQQQFSAQQYGNGWEQQPNQQRQPNDHRYNMKSVEQAIDDVQHRGSHDRYDTYEAPRQQWNGRSAPPHAQQSQQQQQQQQAYYATYSQAPANQHRRYASSPTNANDELSYAAAGEVPYPNSSSGSSYQSFAPPSHHVLRQSSAHATSPAASTHVNGVDHSSASSFSGSGMRTSSSGKDIWGWDKPLTTNSLPLTSAHRSSSAVSNSIEPANTWSQPLGQDIWSKPSVPAFGSPFNKSSAGQTTAANSQSNTWANPATSAVAPAPTATTEKKLYGTSFMIEKSIW